MMLWKIASSRSPRRFALPFLLVLAGFLGSGAFGFGQDSDFNLSAHANSHATAEKIGLPAYPGATVYQDKDSSSADLGLVLNSFHLDLMAVNYVTSDAPEKVLEFYRKPLSRYGEVLECQNGKPVGKRTETRSGLTCSGQKGGHVQVNGSADSSDDHELRAGTPDEFRIVGIAKDAPAGKTQFGLVYLKIPKDQ